MREKSYVPAMRAKNESVDTEKRTLEAVFSDNSVDRDGEIVTPSAFEDRIETFMKNPVVLWNHNPFETPIGHVAEFDIGKDAIEGVVKFRPEGDSALADDVFRAYASGDLTSFSIGFRVFNVEPAEIDEDTGKVTTPPTITDAELFELSAVTLPANTNAVAKHAAAARLMRESLDSYLKATGETLGADRRKLLAGIGPGAEPTFAAPLSRAAILQKAIAIADELGRRLAAGESVPGSERRALGSLAISLIPTKSLVEGDADDPTEVENLLSDALSVFA